MDAAGEARAALRSARDVAYGDNKSCSAVAEHLQKARDAAEAAHAAFHEVESANQVRSEHIAKVDSAISAVEDAAQASGLDVSDLPLVHAALAEARTEVADAKKGVTASVDNATKNDESATDARETAEGIAVRAC